LCLSWSRTPIIGSLTKSISTVCGNRRRTKRIALDALGCSNGGAEIQEWIHIDLIVEDANSAANDKIALRVGLISESDSRSKVVSIRREDGINATSLDQQAFPRDKHGDVLLVAMERPEVFISHAEIQVESLGCLPRILEVKVVGVHYDPTLRIPHRNRRGGHIAGKEVRQCILILAN